MKKSVILSILAIFFALSLLKTALLVASDQKPLEEIFIPLMFTGVCSFLAWKSFRDNASLKKDPLPQEVAEIFFNQPLQTTTQHLQSLANQKAWNAAKLKEKALACVAPILQKALDDGLISQLEEDKILSFCQAFGLNPDEFDQATKNLFTKASILRELSHGEIKQHFDSLDLNFTLIDSEIPIWMFDQVPMAEVKTQKAFTGSTQGTSVEQFAGISKNKGLFNRKGNFAGRSVQVQNQKHNGKLVDEDVVESKGQASVLITSKHLYFQAGHDLRRIELAKILSLQPSNTEVAVYYEAGKTLFFAPEDLRFFVNVIRHLIKINTNSKEFEKTSFEPVF